MLKSMKEVKKFREEIEAMEKEAPIEYGTYEVEVKEAPPMFGERENALARDRFNSDEEYLNALTAALEEKEAIIADNDKLKAEMEADLARLEQKANKHHEIEYTIGQRYEEIDHKYSYINDYDSSKKFKELIDLDRAFSNVPYVLGNNNKIRENELKMKERDANRALLAEEIEKLKAENKKYIEDFDKKAAYVENNIKTKGGFVGMPSTKIVGKKCTMQEINDMAYFRNHLEEYVESAQNMKKLLEDEQKKRIKNYTDNPLIKKGPQIINSLGFYSKEKEIRTNYKEFLTLVLDAIDKEKEEPGAFDKLINSDSFTVKGLISDSKVEITDTMRVIARNARDFEEVRDVIAKKGTLDNLVDNEFVTLQDDLTGDDGLNYLGTLLDNSIRDAKEKIIKRLGDKLDAEIDEMRKYIVSVNDYFNAAVGKEMKAYDQTQNAINMEKQHEQQLYKDLLDKASLDRQYALAYDDIDKKLTEGIEETSKNLKEETLAIKKEIENVKLNMAKAQLIKDVDDAYNIAKGKEPFVIGLDRVNFGKSYSDSGAPLSEGLSRESLLTNMVGDTSASSQKIIDSVYINGITAREYYKGAHSGENLTDDQIKEELGKDMMLLANNAYGIDIKNRSQLEGNVISVKEDGVMRAVIFDNVFTKDIDNLKAPAKPSEPSKWFKSQEKYENQLIEYRSKMDAYEQEKKEYDFYARFAKKGTAEYDFYKSAADRIAKSNSFAEQMCRNMNTMTESEIQERINKNSVLFADANENAKQYKDVNPVVRRGISELTKVSSTGRKNVSLEHKTQPNVHKEAADKGIQPK